MNAPTRQRAMLGDVIEIDIPSGFAYAHYTHKHDRYGALLRVMLQHYSERPADFSWVTYSESQFECFFPLSAAVSRGIVRIAGVAPISAERARFPLFRTAVQTPSGWGPWWLWDGEKEWRIDRLEPGMEQLPIRGILNDTLMFERIQSGWRAAHEA